MRQFVLPEDWDGRNDLRIEGGGARYLLRVLRLAPGDEFAGLDAQGRRRSLRVLEAGADWLLASVSRPLPDDLPISGLRDARGSRGASAARPRRNGAADKAAEAPASRIGLPRVVLVQSLAKAPAMDLVVRQAAEAGVARLIPLRARRSVGRAEAGREDARVDRWERIVREGLQQSGSAVHTRVERPVSVEELADRLGPPSGTRLCLVLHEAPLAQTGLHEYLDGAPNEVVLAVGPEGGFAPDELETLERAGFRPLLLPGAILRTETAALYAVASVEIILSERSSWTRSR
jgi:16S rRNA (uracil1498-N3)-methyltransferase